MGTGIEHLCIRCNVECCRALLVKRVPDEPQRQLVEILLRYMERSTTDSAAPISRNSMSYRRRMKVSDGLMSSLGNSSGVGRADRLYLRELADIANGDQPSADGWHELADAAERIIHIPSKGGST
jgi:hypothetical protein